MQDHIYIDYQPGSYEKTLFPVPFNRKAKIREDLQASILKWDVTKDILIIKTDLFGKRGIFIYYVIDGNNTALNCEKLNKGYRGKLITYSFISQEEIVQFAASHNNTQWPWSLEDYCSAYRTCDRNKDSYILLLNMASKTDYSIHTLATLLNGKHNINKIIKQGDFTINMLTKTNEIINYATELSIASQCKVTSRMLLAIDSVSKHEKFTYERFKRAFIANIHMAIDMNLDRYNSIFTEWL